MIDLRSDTVTRPSRAMRQAMADADVGDDVFGEDPTTRALETEVARVTGKEAALFVTSGTMGNQLAVALHTRPGDEVIANEGSHLVWYECGAGAALSGVQFAVVGGARGYTADEMEAAIRPPAYYFPRTSLAIVENTLNRAGGRVFAQRHALEISERARARGLAVHLDGARIWNASVASGSSVAELVAPFDTASVCFSKGLGAPVGSALCGTAAIVERARRIRKMWGGGMRQSGILAAGALFALRENRARLAEDHANARRLAERVAHAPGATVHVAEVETNIVNIDVAAPADRVSELARELGVAIHASGPHRLRAVTHLDVSRSDVERAAEALAQAISRAVA